MVLVIVCWYELLLFVLYCMFVYIIKYCVGDVKWVWDGVMSMWVVGVLCISICKEGLDTQDV